MSPRTCICSTYPMGFVLLWEFSLRFFAFFFFLFCGSIFNIIFLICFYEFGCVCVWLILSFVFNFVWIFFFWDTSINGTKMNDGWGGSAIAQMKLMSVNESPRKVKHKYGKSYMDNRSLIWYYYGISFFSSAMQWTKMLVKLVFVFIFFLLCTFNYGFCFRFMGFMLRDVANEEEKVDGGVSFRCTLMRLIVELWRDLENTENERKWRKCWTKSLWFDPIWIGMRLWEWVRWETVKKKGNSVHLVYDVLSLWVVAVKRTIVFGRHKSRKC